MCNYVSNAAIHDNKQVIGTHYLSYNLTLLPVDVVIDHQLIAVDLRKTPFSAIGPTVP